MSLKTTNKDESEYNPLDDILSEHITTYQNELEAFLNDEQTEQKIDLMELIKQKEAEELREYEYLNCEIDEESGMIIHYVTKSDTLQGLALKYRVSVAKIKKANKLYNPNMLFTREFIHIPISVEQLDEIIEMQNMKREEELYQHETMNTQFQAETGVDQITAAYYLNTYSYKYDAAIAGFQLDQENQTALSRKIKEEAHKTNQKLNSEKYSILHHQYENYDTNEVVRPVQTQTKAKMEERHNSLFNL
eukprot:TRINITY_DN4796_c0_g1_i2.p1 TRINITY_DN4796_c0_g1~~TRINITY_DN4796_c0_g1_i2.p1  ORF type:complete len:248 (-),score=58.23 TRINITY_DN4796_c0_g1_i2:49-792(-)